MTSHHLMAMTVMEYPSKRFSLSIRRHMNARKMFQNNFLVFTPILNSKPTNLKMSNTVSRHPVIIDNPNSGFIVTIDGSRTRLIIT